MAPALVPALIGQEAAACALLGLVLGSVRAVFPVRGRAAFLPDMALVGAVLLGLQSYAAALSAGGVLRWYMPGSAFLCAFGAERLLRPALRNSDPPACYNIHLKYDSRPDLHDLDFLHLQVQLMHRT